MLITRILLACVLSCTAVHAEEIMSERKIQKITQGHGRHWVGDGFPVNNMFSYGTDNNISPFLLLDYAEPTDFAPADAPKGVGQHPHRGFETVTIVYDGELQHNDTAGNSGKIGAGDVQWMTAARGIMHEERHSDEFTRQGGRLEMVQLWVNLPAKDKMSKPTYQEIVSSKIPFAQLENNSGSIRVIAGSFADIKSNVKTFTPINIFDIRVKEGSKLNIPVKNGFNAMLLVLSGKIDIGNKQLKSSELAIFSPDGEMITFHAQDDAKILFMSGEPINEPIVGKGPFVMNTAEEINQAFSDLRNGNFR